MNYVHLSTAQHDLLVEFRDSHTERPTFKQYETFQKRMKAVDPSTKSKPKQKTIPNTRPGFERSDVKLDDAFDALKDLPVGWCVYSRYDSGSNFGITSAGQHALTQLWNYWNHPLKTTLKLLAEAPASQV